MTATIVWQLVCDAPDCDESYQGRENQSKTQALASAASLGWVHVVPVRPHGRSGRTGDRDYCSAKCAGRGDGV